MKCRHCPSDMDGEICNNPECPGNNWRSMSSRIRKKAWPTVPDKIGGGELNGLPVRRGMKVVVVGAALSSVTFGGASQTVDAILFGRFGHQTQWFRCGVSRSDPLVRLHIIGEPRSNPVFPAPRDRETGTFLRAYPIVAPLILEGMVWGTDFNDVDNPHNPPTLVLRGATLRLDPSDDIARPARQ